jgi:hypothetical protein
MENPRAQPPSPRSRPLALVVALALPILGAVFLVRALPHSLLHPSDADGMIVVGSLNDLHRPPPPPPSVPTPVGDVSLADVRLLPLELPWYSSLASRLRMVYQGETVLIQERRSGMTVWRGPLAKASFREQTEAGGQTLRDGVGKLVWAGAGSGAERRVSVVGTPGSLTVADTHGRLLGRLPIHLIAVHETVHLSVGSRSVSPPSQSITQNGVLDTTGTVLLTYHDASGAVVRRSTVYHTPDHQSGFNG